MKHLLICEDEELARHELETTIPWEKWGFVLIGAAEDGLSGFDLIKTRNPDVVVTDIRMPGIDGISLMKKVNEDEELEEKPMFVVLSGYSDFDYAREALKLGAFDYLMKPVDNDELEATMKKLYTKIEETEKLASLQRAVAEDRAVELLRDLSSKKITESGDFYIDSTIKDISEHYVLDLSAEVCAAKLGISGDHLSRLFKKKTGMTFNEYLTRFRIKQAMELLKDPATRINEVADLTGYTDSRYFSTLFKKVAGMTPSEFRHGRK